MANEKQVELDKSVYRKNRSVVEQMIGRIRPIEDQAVIAKILGLDEPATLVSRPIDSTARNIPR